MKIVYCTDSICYSGGLQTVTVTKANALSKIEGNEVWLIVTDNKREPIEYIDENVHIIDLDVNYFADDWKSKWHVLKGIFIKRREHKKKLQKVLNEIEPDIVISTGTSEKNFLCSIKVKSNPKFIREIHCNKNYRMLHANNLFEKVSAIIGDFTDYNLYIRKYNSIVVLTQEDNCTNWKNCKNILVVPNPIKKTPTTTSELKNKKVITVGRLVESKNFNSLIRAWRLVADKHPDWQLEIWGEGRMYSEHLSLISELNLEKHVFLKGYSYNILEKMTDASIFVLSSAFEGFGLVIVEAMSCGLPIVSYECPYGPKDIIDEGTDGYLVPVNNEEMLAQRISALIEDEQLRKSMGKAALIKSKNYHAENIAQVWMQLFYSLRQQ